MYDTALVFSVRECRLDGFLQSCKSIWAEDEDILYSSVFQAVKDTQPVFAAFVFPNFNGHDLFITVFIDSKDNVGCELADNPVIPDGKMDGIYKHNGVYIW